MPRLNLLPWRETLKKEREIRFGIIAGVSLFGAALIVLAVHMYMESTIEYQKGRNNYLKEEIERQEKKIKEIKTLEQQKTRLIERMNIIQELEESRPKIVHLFDELVKQLPNGMYFTSLSQKGDEIAINGIAQSGARVSTLMKKFEDSEWLTDPEIGIIKDIGKYSSFKLKVKLTMPKKEETP